MNPSHERVKPDAVTGERFALYSKDKDNAEGNKSNGEMSEAGVQELLPRFEYEIGQDTKNKQADADVETYLVALVPEMGDSPNEFKHFLLPFCKCNVQ